MGRRNKVSIERINIHQSNLPKRPRGPKAKVCDVCQLRKVKCTREYPRCSNCVNLNYPCTYNRIINNLNNINRSQQQLLPTVRILPANDGNNNVNNSIIYGRSTNNEQLTTALAKLQVDKENYSKIDTNFIFSLLNKPQLNPALNLIQQMLKLSIINNSKAQISINEEGDYFYTGPSLATSYVSINLKLLNNTNNAVNGSDDSNNNYYNNLTNKSNTNNNILNNILNNNNPIKKLFNSTFPVSKTVINKTYQSEVINLYFIYLNTFYPIISPTSFYYQLNHCKPNNYPFLTLLYVICLCGSSFYPNRNLANKFDEYFSNKILFYIKRCYLKPNLNVIQACTLIGLHLNSTESNSILCNAWFFGGLAHRMSMQLGYFSKSCPFRSKTNRQIIARTLWLLSINEVLMSHCTNRLSWIGAEGLIDYPNINDSIIMVNIEDKNKIIEVPEMLQIKGENSLKYFQSVCKLMKLMSKMDNLNKKYKLKEEIKFKIPNSSFFKTVLAEFNYGENNTNHSDTNNSVNKVKSYDILETAALKWYLKLPEFNCPSSKDHAIYLPTKNDYLLSILNIYFFSYLIDINKFQIGSNEIIEINNKNETNKNKLEILFSDQILFQQYHQLNKIEKCFYCSRMMDTIISSFNGKLEMILTPWFWYSNLQMILVFLMVLRRHQESVLPDWVIKKIKQFILNLKKRLSFGSKRWALVKDCFVVMEPIISKYV